MRIKISLLYEKLMLQSKHERKAINTNNVSLISNICAKIFFKYTALSTHQYERKSTLCFKVGSSNLMGQQKYYQCTILTCAEYKFSLPDI